MRIRAPDDAPKWAHTFAKTILDAVRGPRDAPLGLQDYASSSLPAAADWVNCAIWVSDIKRIAVSDGTHWIRQDTGASL
jgi:hypothetical protein